jgi:hypothetical protein
LPTALDLVGISLALESQWGQCNQRISPNSSNMDEEKQPEEQPTPQTEEHFPFFQNCSKTFQFTQVIIIHVNMVITHLVI